MKNKFFSLICILALNTPCFAMMESDIEDDLNSTSASIPTSAETTTKPKRNMHSKIKTDDSWMKKTNQEIESPQKDIPKRRSSLLLDKYQSNLEFSQSNPLLSNIEKPEVGRLKKSRHSLSIPKLERAHSGMLTIEDHIAREYLSADILAEDIFLLTHLLYNRLTLAMNDPKLENYVETVKKLKESVINGYKKAFNYAEQMQLIPNYFQDYAHINDEINMMPQSATSLIEFMKSLHIAETLKTEARNELESGFLKHFDDDAIDNDMAHRGLFLRTIQEILLKCRLYMDKYPYAHAYGEIASKDFYIKQFLAHFKNLINERLSKKRKKISDLQQKRSSFTVSTMRNAKLEKVASQLNLTTEIPSVPIPKKKESYLAPVKKFLKEVIQNIDQEIMFLQESEITLTTSSPFAKDDSIDTCFLSYWTHPIHKFEHNNKLDAEEFIFQLSKIVEIYEKALLQIDPISYDPLHMFNLFYKEVNPYWAEYNFYIHFTENTPHISDKKDAFNPFGFLPLNEYECRFLAEHHCGRGKLKVTRDFLK